MRNGPSCSKCRFWQKKTERAGFCFCSANVASDSVQDMLGNTHPLFFRHSLTTQGDDLCEHFEEREEE